MVLGYEGPGTSRKSVSNAHHRLKDQQPSKLIVVMRLAAILLTLAAVLLASSEASKLHVGNDEDDTSSEERWFIIRHPSKKVAEEIKSSKWQKALNKLVKFVLPDTSKFDGSRVYVDGQWKWRNYYD
ncbi:unnamed protein product [Phytophthora lilii]|uniref:Unnamed protein product n=1 Tax=Phytophthora lilii TaxID=2077276 RepID=A0A9W6U351_9STRA|nr:unnamed protein product [Phytophthora lilii]